MKGKAKEDFEKWYSGDSKWININGRNINVYDEIEIFYCLPFSMQYGPIVDFFDSVGIQIDIEFKRHEDGEEYFTYYFDQGEDLDEYKTRPEAREASIKKACEIYNEQNK